MVDRITEGLVLKPGDKVLVSIVDPTMYLPAAEDMMERLQERFPGVEFTVVAGAIAVQRGES